MFDVPKRSIWFLMDRPIYFTNQKYTPKTFEVGEQVYLLISLHTMSIVKSPTRYCGQWKILKKNLGKVAYKLDLPIGSRIHSIFHISRLKECLLNDETMANGFLALQNPIEVHQVLLSRKGHPLFDATLESVSKFQKAFPNFTSAMMINCSRGMVCHDLR